ncbi:MAG: HindVP family restriction endonuclease [Coriobacteriia bacterium]|nr:HindVP family restriction endonuclease [Coriobacteriia bacterium]
MLDNEIPAIYNRLEIEDGRPVVVSSEISFANVFKTGNRSFEEIEFRFESAFDPYQKYSFDDIGGIDLVVCSTEGAYLSPLEVKMTVMPTSDTSHLPEEKWGCELVVRPATTSYCAIGMFDAVQDAAADVRGIFENACASIQSWDNDFEMLHKVPRLSACIDAFEKTYLHLQKPFLMQTIWKTDGQSPILAENAFDVIIWSDFAFSRLFVDDATEKKKTMSRQMRASARMARCLWELSKSAKIRVADIYRQMAFGNQTDREFSVQGPKWRRYVSSNLIPELRLKKDVINQIIEPGYLEKLQPERRFDQTLYFTTISSPPAL